MSTIACVFPGQGSQSVGMLANMAAAYPIIEETFKQASESLGYDLWHVVQNDDGNQLNETHITQPALLTASVALWRVYLEEGGTRPEYLAGHSLGEYSALVCAGVLSLADAVKLVRARGEYMQQAVPAGQGAMFAIIGLADDEIAKQCDAAATETSEVVAPVNFNSPGQVVIAGSASAAQNAADKCKAAGAKRALPLAVSVPSHCALMKPAADKLAELLQSMTFNTPEVAVVNNVDVAIESSPEKIKEALVRQLFCPVRWTESVEFLADNGIDTILEIGPGKVLSGLTKRIDKSLQSMALNEPKHFEELDN